MPSCLIQTNVPGDAVNNSDTLKALSSVVASSIGKPERYVMVSLNTDTPMCFAGTEEPCAFCEIISLGSIGGEKNKAISAALSQVVSEKLGVPADRFYIKFVDPQRSDFGYNGSTF